MPSISKAIHNHLHSKQNCILARLLALFDAADWNMQCWYFLLLFGFSLLFGNNHLHPTISDFLLLLFLLLLLMLLFSFLLFDHLFVFIILLLSYCCFSFSCWRYNCSLYWYNFCSSFLYFLLLFFVHVMFQLILFTTNPCLFSLSFSFSFSIFLSILQRQIYSFMIAFQVLSLSLSLSLPLFLYSSPEICFFSLTFSIFLSTSVPFPLRVISPAFFFHWSTWSLSHSLPSPLSLSLSYCSIFLLFSFSCTSNLISLLSCISTCCFSSVD